jgi:hypothetical protein
VGFHHTGAMMQLNFPTLILLALLVIQLENIQLFVGFGQSLALNSCLMDSFSKHLPYDHLSDS